MRRGLTVKDGVDESCVKAAEQHKRFEKEHADRPGQDDDNHLVDVQRFELIGCNNITALSAHCFRLLLENDRSIGLGNE